MKDSRFSVSCSECNENNRPQNLTVQLVMYKLMLLAHGGEAMAAIACSFAAPKESCPEPCGTGTRRSSTASSSSPSNYINEKSLNHTAEW